MWWIATLLACAFLAYRLVVWAVRHSDNVDAADDAAEREAILERARRAYHPPTGGTNVKPPPLRGCRYAGNPFGCWNTPPGRRTPGETGAAGASPVAREAAPATHTTSPPPTPAQGHTGGRHGEEQTQ